MSPDEFRKILRDSYKSAEFHNAVGSVVRPILREELEPLKEAVLILADHMPGSMQGQKSHVRKKVEAVK